MGLKFGSLGHTYALEMNAPPYTKWILHLNLDGFLRKLPEYMGRKHKPYRDGMWWRKGGRTVVSYLLMLLGGPIVITIFFLKYVGLSG